MNIEKFDFIKIENEKIFIDEKEVAINNTPCIFYSANRISENIKLFKDSLKDYNYKICFALKCCYNNDLHKVMFENNIDCEVMSELEFDIALKSGFQPKNMIVNGVGKTKSEMEKYIINDVFSINVDSLDDLKLIQEIANNLNKKVNVGIRIKTDINDDIFISKDCKLGLSIDNDEAENILIEAIKDKNLNLEQVGFHMFSRFTEYSEYHRIMIPKITNWLNYIYKKYNIKFKNINFGGGLESRVLIGNNLDFLNKILNDFSNKLNYKAECFVFEPGRFIVSDTAVGVSEVQAIKNNWIFIDMPTSFLVPLKLANFFTFDLKQNKDRRLFNVADGSCSPTSVISYDAELNKEIKVGDKVIIANCGAYTFPFCSVWYRELPEVFLVKNNEVKNILSKKQIDYIINNFYDL